MEDSARLVLRQMLAEVPPFSSLDDEGREELVEASDITHHDAGELVLDGFRNPATDVYVVLDGRVGLWQTAEAHGQPDDTENPGGFFGFSAMLTGRNVGPRARALTRCTVARIPGAVADHAFETPAGARFLTDHLLSFAERTQHLPGYATVGALVDEPPLVVDPGTPLREVARELTEQRRPGVVVRLPDGTMGLVTDGSIRRRVMVEGIGLDAPASEALSRDVQVVRAGDSTGEALIRILEARTDAALVTDQWGKLQGVVGLREFALSPTTADVGLHEQLRLSTTPEELVQRAGQTPDVLAGLLAQGLSGATVIRVHAGLVDVVTRRALRLCFERHPELPMDEFTWLALGSNGRREAVLSSDVESAVVFNDGVDEFTMARYRAVFAEVHELLARAGLSGDINGVSASRAIMARPATQWRAAVEQWLTDPHKDQGGMMISLLVDSRPISGAAGRALVSQHLQDLRQHPVTMRLLLHDALSMKAKTRQWDTVFRRSTQLDIKHDALRPLVNLARWVGLAVHSGKLTTPDRLAAAVGSELVDEREVRALAEGYEVLQRVRLRHQIAQVQSGREPNNLLDLSKISPIDRSILGEVVHGIARAQKRLANVSAWSETEDWKL